MPEETSPPVPAHDAYAALRIADFRYFMAGNFLGVFGMQMQAAAIDWELYERTGSSLNLGLVGLVQLLPFILLAPITGHFADRFDRRKIVMGGLSLIVLASVGLAWVSARHGQLWLIFLFLFVGGVARAFQQPARASLLPQLVPPAQLSNAVAWNTGGFHLATMLGPSIGGALIDMTGGAALDYLIYATAALCYIGFLTRIRIRPVQPSSTGFDARDFAAGFAYLWRNQIVLAAITLDLLAVLLGGATAMLPVYAKQLLDVGPMKLGLMQAAPATGAFVMSVLLAHFPPFPRAGRALLGGVAGFGVATVVFGLSRSYGLSLACLLLIGALDNISVVIRHTLVQILTPNELRGRVSAVNGVFIGASNELGRFESGMVAHWTNETISVVSGGLGTLLVVAFVSVTWPALRGYGRLGSATETKGTNP